MSKSSEIISKFELQSILKADLTRYDFVACNLLTTRLRHEKSCGILKRVSKPYDNRGLKLS